MSAASGAAPGMRHDEGGDDADVVAHLDLGAGDLGDDGMLGQRRLHLQRRDAIAERLHEVVGAAAVEHVAVGIDDGEVAADEPLAAIDVALLPAAVANSRASGPGRSGARRAGLLRRRASGSLPPSTGSTARRRPACALPTAPGLRGTPGPDRDVGRDLAHAERFVERPCRCAPPSPRTGPAAAIRRPSARAAARRSRSGAGLAYFRIWR